MFPAHPAETGAALHALVVINGGTVRRRVDMDGTHRADGYTVGAGDTFSGIDLHLENCWISMASIAPV